MPTSPRVRYKRCGVKRNPPVTASPCQPPLGKGAKGTGDADCHSQCAHWPRNDREFYMGCGGCPGGEIGEAPPVADAARRFRGSAPIGGHNSGRESAGTTVGKRTPPLRKRYMKCGADKGRPGGPPLRFLYPLFISYIHFLYTLCGALRRINLPGAGVCLCRPTRCGPRPGAFPGRWLFPPGRSRCGVRPESPGPGL